MSYDVEKLTEFVTGICRSDEVSPDGLYMNSSIFSMLINALDAPSVNMLADVDYAVLYEGIEDEVRALTVGYTYSYLQQQVFESLIGRPEFGLDLGRPFPEAAAWAEFWHGKFKNRMQLAHGYTDGDTFYIH